MSTPLIARLPILSLLAGVAAICLSSCEAPHLNSVDPDAVTLPSGPTPVPITLRNTDQRGNFTAQSRLIIDGKVDGAGTGITVNEPLKFVTSDELTAALNIDSSALPGGHTIVVSTVGGPSEPRDFFVQCAACPLPPRLTSVDTIPVSSVPFYQGRTLMVRIRGKNLQNNNPTVLISGMGVTFDPNIQLNVQHAGDVDFFDLPIVVAANADPGLHDVKVSTRGGPSNAITISVRVPLVPPRITTASTSGAGCLQPGVNSLSVIGDGFAAGTKIRVAYLVGNQFYETEGRGTVITDSHMLQTEIDVQDIRTTPQSVDLVAENNSGVSDVFSTVCSDALRPILRTISPSVVAQGTFVYVKCEGDNFNEGRIIVQEGKGVTILDEYGLVPVAADPDHVRVALLKIEPNAEPSVLITVVDRFSRPSNTQRLTISPPSVPYIQSVTPNFVPAGGDVDVQVRAAGLPPADSIRFSGPGVTISNVQYSSDYTFMTFHVHADSTATWSNDEATNLVLGNPYAFTVAPPLTGPLLYKVRPSHITKGTSVYVECQGERFGLNGPLDVRVQGDSGVSAAILRRPTRENPDRLLVPLVGADTLTASTAMIQVVDRQGRVSNAVPLFIDEPVAGKPYLRVFFTFLAFDVRRGQHGGGSVVGANFQGINDASWRVTSAGPVLFSNTKVNASPRSTNSATFDVDVDPSSVLTGDAATNLIVTTPFGQSNPIACNISP